MSKPTIHRAMLLRDEPRLQAILPQGAILCGQEPVEVVLASDYVTLEADRDRLKVIADNYSALLMDANAENAKLRAELERRAVDDHTEQALAMVPITPTQAMISAGWKVGLMGMDRDGPQAIYTAMLAAAPSAPKADDPALVQAERWQAVCGDWQDTTLSIHGERTGYIACGIPEKSALALIDAHNAALPAAIAAARQEGGKV